MLKYFYCIAFVGLFSSAFGQITSEKRLEFDLKEDEIILQSYPVGKQGLLTLGIEQIKGAADNYILSKYDTDLEKIDQISFEKESKLYLSGFFPNKDTSELVCLFENKKEYIVKRFNLEEFKVTENRFPKEDLLFRTYDQIPYVVNNKIYFRGIRKKQPWILIINLESGSQQQIAIPGINKARSIESFTIDALFENILIFQRDGKDLKKAEMNLVIMDLNGEMSNPMVLDKNPEYSIIDGEITWFGENNFIVAGTYGAYGKSNVASGYYITKWEDGKQQFIKYHSFTDFENFLKYLPERTQKRIEKKKERKTARGVTDYIKTRVAIHPVQLVDGVYRIVGEVYYPTYRTETYTSTGANGVMTTSTRQVFDGYQYSHAAILDLNETGEKIKDYCFVMYLFYKPFSVVLNLRIQADQKTGDMHFIFANGGSIKAATISNSSELSEVDFGMVETETEGDKVRYTGGSRSQYWYDNVYILDGTQVIKNKENENVKKRRTVYYLNKISYSTKW